MTNNDFISVNPILFTDTFNLTIAFDSVSIKPYNSSDTTTEIRYVLGGIEFTSNYRTSYKLTELMKQYELMAV